MTHAVCVNCGAMKWGAFTDCESCGIGPDSEIEFAYSLALTDHYFKVETLEEISASMRGGKPRPSLPPDQEEAFCGMVREYREKLLRSKASKLARLNKER